MGHVPGEGLQIGLGQAGGVRLKLGEQLAGQLGGGLEHHGVVGQAQVGLGRVQPAEFLLPLPELQGAAGEVDHVLLDVLADEAVVLPGFGRRGDFFRLGLPLGEHLLLHGVEQAL